MEEVGVATNSDAPTKKSITVFSWNCCGLPTGIPYIQKLMGGKPGLIVLFEHWLLPYELEKFSSELAAMGKANSRISAESDGGRGYGGVDVVWHKRIGAIPVDGISSDLLC